MGYICSLHMPNMADKDKQKVGPAINSMLGCISEAVHHRVKQITLWDIYDAFVFQRLPKKPNRKSDSTNRKLGCILKMARRREKRM